MNEKNNDNNNNIDLVNFDSPESKCWKKVNKEQDKFLPIANVGRIMKKVIPTNGKIAKEAKETVQECVSEFISFVTGEASDKCQREKRKTINGDDIIWSITLLGFDNYVNPLKTYLSNYRELEGEKLNNNNVPKQQQQHQHQHQHQQRIVEQNNDDIFQQLDVQVMSPYQTSVYSSATMMVQQQQDDDEEEEAACFMGDDQSFSLTLDGIQKNYYIT